ncbi:MAG: DUF4266 domain-containing protein [Myxococcota bacterium]
MHLVRHFLEPVRIGVRTVRARALRAGLIGTALALGGCVTVSPYQRGRLAQPDMTLERPADLAAGQDHADEYREASVGGWGGGGGGCGCN